MNARSIRAARSAALCLGLAACASQEDSAPDTVRVVVRADASGVHASYVLPAQATRLALSAAPQVRSSTWVFDGDGAKFEAGGDAIAFDRPTDRFAVTLRPFDGNGQRDRVYSPVVPTGDGTVTVYLAYLAVDRSVYRTTVAVDAPAWAIGGVPHRGLARAWRSDQPAAYALIGDFPIIRNARYSLSIDPAMHGWMRTEIVDTTKAAFSEYGRLLGPAAPTAPWVLATYGDRAAAGASLHGDSLDAFVRLNFSGGAWSTPTDLETNLRLFVAHEIFHLWNGSHDGAESDELPVWIKEGGADAAALDLVRRIGGIGSADATAIENRALATCAAADGVTFKEKLAAKQGNAPYACGAALFYLVERAALDGPRTASPMDLWRDLLKKRERDRAPRYRPQDFVDAAGRSGGDEGRTIAAALVDSEDDWNTLLARLSPRLGLREVPGDPMTIAARLVFQLMKSDCGNGYGFWRETAALLVDANASCRNFDRPVRLSGALGHDFKAHAAEAYRAAEDQCRHGGIVTIDNDGDHVLKIPCTTPLKPLSTTFGFVPAPG